VLPPVSILTPEQTKYYFLSGFTAKLAGTERGITEPTPTFSACFGAAFLSLHPTKYGEELVKRMQQSGATAYLVNTGWNGTGKRISIKDTRGIIDAILDGSIDKAQTKTLPIFDFKIPTALPGVDPKILDPRDTYKSAKDWDVKAEDLAGRFVKNFTKFTGNEEAFPTGIPPPARPKSPRRPRCDRKGGNGRDGPDRPENGATERTTVQRNGRLRPALVPPRNEKAGDPEGPPAGDPDRPGGDYFSFGPAAGSRRMSGVFFLSLRKGPHRRGPGKIPYP